MTKKELEKKVADLEVKVAELTSALLALSARTPGYVFIPAPLPILPPPVIQPNPYPFTPVWPNNPTIICGTNVCKQQDQNTQSYN